MQPRSCSMSGLEPHMATGSGALAVSANAFVNFADHVCKQHLRWRSAILFAVFGILGQRLVPRSAKSLTERGCFSFFAMLMIVVGVLMLRRQKDGGADCEHGVLKAPV